MNASKKKNKFNMVKHELKQNQGAQPNNGADMDSLTPIIGGSVHNELNSRKYPKCYLIGNFQEPIFIPISDELFKQVRLAKKNLSATILIEHAYNYAMENYLEFEREILHATAHDLVFTMRDEEEYRNISHNIGRRIENHLSTIRSYRDISKKLTSAIFGRKSKEYIAHCVSFDKALTSSKYYAVVENLRNYSQHVGKVFTNLIFKGNWIDIDDANSKLRRMLVPQLSVDTLRKDRNNKPPVSEMKSGQIIDLREYIRGHLEIMWEIHSGLRNRHKDHLLEWEATIESISEMYLSHSNSEKSLDQKLLGLQIYQWFPKSKDLEIVEELHRPYLFSYKQLIAKNQTLVHLRKRYVSNELGTE
ncbi:hypothetical protein ACFL6E_02390 [Candidatus Neomarinimicrobiota bacterium]